MKGDLVEWLKANSSADNPKRFQEIYQGSGLHEDYSIPKVTAYLSLLVQEKRIKTIKISEKVSESRINKYNMYWFE